MKANFIKTKGILITFLLSLFGVVSCSDDPTPEMYGTPSADYKISGRVTTEDGAAIKGIEVTVNNVNGVAPQELTTTTSEDGTYDINITKGSYTTDIEMSFKDIDGEENGSFSNQDKTIALEESDFKGADEWYHGVVESNNVDAKLAASTVDSKTSQKK